MEENLYHLNKENFEEIIKIAEKYKNEIIFAKLNVDENPDIASKFGIMSIPTFLVFKNGEVVGKIVGAMPEKILEEKILEFLK
jgi:thioredoxin 1